MFTPTICDISHVMFFFNNFFMTKFWSSLVEVLLSELHFTVSIKTTLTQHTSVYITKVPHRWRVWKVTKFTVSLGTVCCQIFSGCASSGAHILAHHAYQLSILLVARVAEKSSPSNLNCIQIEISASNFIPKCMQFLLQNGKCRTLHITFSVLKKFIATWTKLFDAAIQFKSMACIIVARKNINVCSHKWSKTKFKHQMQTNWCQYWIQH